MSTRAKHRSRPRTKLNNILRLASMSALVMGFFSFALHEYYLSMADGDVVEDRIEFSLRLDLEDMTTLFSEEYQLIAFLGEENEHVYVDSLLHQYLSKNFILSQSGNSSEIDFVGKEVEEDLLWIYFTTATPDFSKKWTLKNTLLYKYFPDQVNVVRISTPEGNKNGYFKKSEPIYTFEP